MNDVEHPGEDDRRFIPWQQITATRNILAHNYTAADRHIVWLALSDELPPLIRKTLGT